MRKLILKMSMSIDGFVGGPNGENDWIFRSSDETSRAWVLERCWDSGLIIMGRKSFMEMSPYWPTASGPFAEPMNTIPKAVFTQKGFTVPPPTSDSVSAKSWSDARVFDGDLRQEIQKLKAESGKPMMALGGAGFARSLIAAGLVDEYHLAVHPVALGNGLRIFDGLTQPRDLKLVEARSFAGGITAQVYRA